MEKLLEKLRGHDRVIQLIESEVDEASKRLSLVMELGEVDLSALLSEHACQQLSLNFIRHIWEQMLQAVQVVHDAGIVHTDLKPANFVLVKGHLKLIDFGIAKAIPNDTTNIARDAQVGTANYMSPEALSESGSSGRLWKMGRPTDVWALGCILYQMVYGYTPYSRLRPLHVKIVAIQNPNHVIDYPPYAIPTNELCEPRNDLRVVVGPDLVRVMRSCLRYNPKERASIPQLLEDSFLRGTPAADTRAMLTPALAAELVAQTLDWQRSCRATSSREDERSFAESLCARFTRAHISSAKGSNSG